MVTASLQVLYHLSGVEEVNEPLSRSYLHTPPPSLFLPHNLAWEPLVFYRAAAACQHRHRMSPPVAVVLPVSAALHHRCAHCMYEVTSAPQAPGSLASTIRTHFSRQCLQTRDIKDSALRQADLPKGDGYLRGDTDGSSSSWLRSRLATERRWPSKRVDEKRSAN